MKTKKLNKLKTYPIRIYLNKGESMRDIEFRFWNGHELSNSELFSLTLKGGLIYDGGSVGDQLCDYVIEQYTGLKDKNGVKIFENSEINSEYKVLYKAPKFVLQNILTGDIIDFKKGEVYEITA